MTLSTYEPPTGEIRITLALGLTILSPYYRGFARSLNLRGSEKVLDFGSGSGICSRHMAAVLQRGGGTLDCVDVSERWMATVRKTLRKFNNVRFHLGHITRLNLPQAGFDLAVSHFVLHDIPAVERPAVVQALARTLKPGGALILREPQNEGLAPDEINRITAAAGLRPASFVDHKIAIGAVYDARYLRNKD